MLPISLQYRLLHILLPYSARGFSHSGLRWNSSETCSRTKKRAAATKQYRCSNGFASEIKNSGLPEEERRSMPGGLDWLRQKSLKKQSQILAEKYLAGKRYNNKDVRCFVSDCYQLRSSLTHGGLEAGQDLSLVCSELDKLVADLLVEAAQPERNWPALVCQRSTVRCEGSRTVGADSLPEGETEAIEKPRRANRLSD